ncbi:hypothetical protein PR002_g22300 [Phytophthora rubi]|uniref:Uncharacterized protein n=1 Tax=Phytophthora rubi TaxID=129364 RepID=A0A6A3IU97_9STRA|nr:hypothetical protein PR002_g22300 [Phytophthora rubi]
MGTTASSKLWTAQAQLAAAAAHSLTISKLKESYEVEIGKLQNELNEVKAKNSALKEVVTGTASLPNLEAK